MKVGSYRDGGTRSFYDASFDSYFKERYVEICEDNGIGSETRGQWYLGYPRKGRLLTNEERVFCVEKIIAHLNREYKSAKRIYEDILESNPDCTFEDDFQQEFSLSSSSYSGGNTLSSYKGNSGMRIVNQNGSCTLIHEDEKLFEGTLKDCFKYYLEN